MQGDRDRTAGLGWGLAAALLTAGWWVVTRHGVSTAADPYQITAMRFAISGTLLAPVLWRHRHTLVAVPAPLLAVLVLCAGAPYSLMTGAGLRAAPAGNGGTLVAGALPFFSALLSMLVLKERIAPLRWAGLTCILCGIAGIGGATAAPGAVPLFVLAGLMWAGFAVALRRSGLPTPAAVALVCCTSALLYLPPYLLLAPAPGHDLTRILPQALYQGVVSAVVAVYCFGRAVQLLGAARASLFAALVPVLTSLLGAALLDEWPGAGEAACIATVAAGAALASGAIRCPTAIRMRWPARLPGAGAHGAPA